MISCFITKHDRYYARALRRGQQGNLRVKPGAPGIPLCRVSPQSCQMRARSVSCGARRHVVGRVVTSPCPCAPRQRRGDVICVTRAAAVPVRSVGGCRDVTAEGQSSQRLICCIYLAREKMCAIFECHFTSSVSFFSSTKIYTPFQRK